MGAFALPQPFTCSACGSFPYTTGMRGFVLHIPAQQPAFPFSILAHFNGKTFLKPCQTFANCNKQQQQQKCLLHYCCYFQADFSMEG